MDVLRRAGAEVVLAAEEEEDRVKIEVDCNIKAVTAVKIGRPTPSSRWFSSRISVTGRQGGKEGWDLIAIPGGMPGAERIRDSVRLHPALEKHWRAMRPLAMICANSGAAASLVGVERQQGLPGRRRRDEPSRLHRRDRRKFGGDAATYTEGRVVWDANIITSRGPGTAQWSLCCVEAIFGRAKALEVAGPMVTQPATLPPKRPFFEWRLEEEVSRVDRDDVASTRTKRAMA